MAGTVGTGYARCGMERFGRLCVARRVQDGCDEVRRGRHGAFSSGFVWIVKVRSGPAGYKKEV